MGIRCFFKGRLGKVLISSSELVRLILTMKKAGHRLSVSCFLVTDLITKPKHPDKLKFGGYIIILSLICNFRIICFSAFNCFYKTFDKHNNDIENDG